MLNDGDSSISSVEDTSMVDDGISPLEVASMVGSCSVEVCSEIVAIPNPSVSKNDVISRVEDELGNCVRVTNEEGTTEEDVMSKTDEETSVEEAKKLIKTETKFMSLSEEDKETSEDVSTTSLVVMTLEGDGDTIKSSLEDKRSSDETIADVKLKDSMSETDRMSEATPVSIDDVIKTIEEARLREDSIATSSEGDGDGIIIDPERDKEASLEDIAACSSEEDCVSTTFDVVKANGEELISSMFITDCVDEGNIDSAPDVLITRDSLDETRFKNEDERTDEMIIEESSASVSVAESTDSMVNKTSLLDLVASNE
uniref:Uncharacterized protein n=1 Tax=Amphimedon queenslandica TaxID=400682 RepID=A0A1X7VGB7_AMPQE